MPLQVRAYQAGAKSPENPGEVMYSPNEIEPHFALQLYAYFSFPPSYNSSHCFHHNAFIQSCCHHGLNRIEKTLRLSQTAEQRSRALAQGREAGWDDGKKDKKDEDDQKQPPRRPPPMWYALACMFLCYSGLDIAVNQSILLVLTLNFFRDYVQM